MAEQSSRTSIIIAIIGALGLIIVALIQFKPWEHNDKKSAPLVFSGVVMDESSAGIPNADISIAGRNETSSTDRNGNFHFEIKNGPETIRVFVRKAGFLTYDKNFNLPDSNAVIIINK